MNEKGLKEIVEKVIEKTGFDGEEFTLKHLYGGYYNIILDASSITDFVLNYWNDEEEASFVDFITYKSELENALDMYSGMDNSFMISLHEQIRENVLNREGQGYLTLEEHLEYVYNSRDGFNGLVSLEQFKDKFNDKFYRKANEFIEEKNKKHYEKEVVQNKIKKIKGLVYLLKIENRNEYKIGVTINLKKRLNQLGTKMPFKLETITKIRSKDIYKLEEKLHCRFENKRINGEWFNLSNEDVEYIRGIKDEY